MQRTDSPHPHVLLLAVTLVARNEGDLIPPCELWWEVLLLVNLRYLLQAAASAALAGALLGCPEHNGQESFCTAHVNNRFQHDPFQIQMRKSDGHVATQGHSSCMIIHGS